MTVISIERAIAELSNHFVDGRLIPFIGPGFSQPLGLPGWEELLGSVVDKLNEKFEKDLFILHGSFPQLADYVKIQDRQAWRDWLHEMTVEFDSKDASEKRKSSVMHKALASLKWSTIYTTNYDSHIEGALDDANVKYTVLASLVDFLEPRSVGVCEVVKFHGTLKDPDTIVLTESNYFDRMELESALDQKLRVDILSNSFMFIGYGFNDQNIRYIWYKIHKMLESQKEKNGSAARPRPSYFIAFGANPVQPVLLDKWNIHVVLLDAQDKLQAIADFLTSINA